ncbi:MAG: low molecular weight protein arginine phosphatase [Nitrospirota bacterium]
MFDSDNRINIMAICTGNICRSPMAEGILVRIFGNNPGIGVSSAGTHALNGNQASEFAVIAAYENGVDISGHRSRLLDAVSLRSSDLILCMEPVHIEWVLSMDITSYGKVYNLAEFSGGNRIKKIPDPYGSSLSEYRKCFSDIYTCIRNFVGTIPLLNSINAENRQ